MLFFKDLQVFQSVGIRELPSIYTAIIPRMLIDFTVARSCDFVRHSATVASYSHSSVVQVVVAIDFKTFLLINQIII